MDYSFPPYIDTITLGTKAITNWDKEHEVTLRKGINGEVVLDINGTPGKWYLSTLDQNRKNFDKAIFIDHGADWSCLNFDVVMKNAREIFEEFKKKNIREIIV